MKVLIILLLASLVLIPSSLEAFAQTVDPVITEPISSLPETGILMNQTEGGTGGDTSNSKNFKKGMLARNTSGKNNGMYGRSAISENNLKWYHNGSKTIYVTEGTQPKDFIRGRLNGKKKLVIESISRFQ